MAEQWLSDGINEWSVPELKHYIDDKSQAIDMDKKYGRMRDAAQDQHFLDQAAEALAKKVKTDAEAGNRIA